MRLPINGLARGWDEEVYVSGLGILNRPLICGVLKPVGLTPEELAGLAHEFVMGGLDLIKDDQGLVDQAFCRFDERIPRCAAAVGPGQ